MIKQVKMEEGYKIVLLYQAQYRVALANKELELVW